MITFGLNYTVKPEFVEQFVAISQEVLGLMDSLAGHVQTRLYMDYNQSNAFMIYSEWENEDFFRDFVRSDAFKNVQNMSRDMLETMPKHKIYETRAMGGPKS